MTHLFFHVHRRGFVARDFEGMETLGLDNARDEAISAIRTILVDELLSGSIDLSGSVVITDEADAPLLIVPFTEAVEVGPGFH